MPQALTVKTAGLSTPLGHVALLATPPAGLRLARVRNRDQFTCNSNGRRNSGRETHACRSYSSTVIPAEEKDLTIMGQAPDHDRVGISGLIHFNYHGFEMHVTDKNKRISKTDNAFLLDQLFDDSISKRNAPRAVGTAILDRNDILSINT